MVSTELVSSAALMLKLKAVVQEEERLLPTVGGGLLFCPEPQRFPPQARIQAARFKGSTTDEFIDQQNIGGSLLEQVDQCLNFIKRNIRLRGVVMGLQREDRYEYPLPAQGYYQPPISGNLRCVTYYRLQRPTGPCRSGPAGWVAGERVRARSITWPRDRRAEEKYSI